MSIVRMFNQMRFHKSLIWGKYFLFIPSLFFWIMESSFAQQLPQSLVQIHNDRPGLIEYLSQLRIGIYHISETEIFAGLSPDQIGFLQKQKVSFRTLDQLTEGKHYFLAESRFINSISPESLPGTLLWSDGSSSLLCTQAEEIDQRDNSFIRYVEMKQRPLTVREENVVQSTWTTAPLDTTIQKTIAGVSPDSIRATVQTLQNFGTRFLGASTRDQVAIWIRDQFLMRGLQDVVLDSFYLSVTRSGQTVSGWQKNVVATIRGKKNPGVMIVVGGHHDSYSSGNPMIVAPGADDNASGTAAVLELARVLQKTGYTPEVTIKFVTFAAEEYGLYGGYDFAAKAAASGSTIKLMINHDMISNSAVTSGMGVSINYYSGYLQQAQMARDLTARFTILNSAMNALNSSGSDSYAFWVNGFPAVYFEERDFSPYYHTPSDLITNTNPVYCAEVVKGSCATLIQADQVPSAPQNFMLVDRGDGSRLIASWTASPENDVVQYSIRVGTSSGTYTRNLKSTTPSIIIDSLIDGMQYYIGLSAVDADGNASPFTERIQIPRSRPLAPSQLMADAQWHAVQLRWSKNTEADLKGYTLYRSTLAGQEGTRLTGTVLQDTIFIDQTVQNGQYYYYTLKAIDSTNLESIGNQITRSRAVSLDQGVCIVDETKDGNGEPMNPTDAQVDSFYMNILTDYRPMNFDIASEGGVTLADLGAYGTIVWHGNDVSDLTPLTQAKNDIAKYLDYGGKIVITTYRPTSALAGNNASSAVFGPGNFMYDKFRISKAENAPLSRFRGAGAIASGYPTILTDTIKTMSVNSQLSAIEAIYAGPGAREILSYMSQYDSTNVFGKLNGKPVGVEYLGPVNKSIVISFPLYYMAVEQSKSLMRHILNDQFGVPLKVESSLEEIPGSFALSQNYPNPFNPTTTFQFQIPISGLVTIKVYDILGRHVVTLLNEMKSVGAYQVTWNASSFPSGVYFYRLQSGRSITMKKAILLK